MWNANIEHEVHVGEGRRGEGEGRSWVSCVSLNTQRCVYVTETMSHQGSLPSQGVRARLDPREHLHGLGS